MLTPLPAPGVLEGPPPKESLRGVIPLQSHLAGLLGSGSSEEVANVWQNGPTRCLAALCFVSPFFPQCQVAKEFSVQNLNRSVNSDSKGVQLGIQM